MTIGQRIRILREEKDMTIVEVSKKAGVCPATISKWENRGYIPRLPELSRVSKVLGISVDEIIGRKKIEHKKKFEGSLGQIIREERKKRHMTQRQLGDLAGIKGTTILRWEKEMNMPDVLLLSSLADALQMNIEDFIAEV